ncbi:MAG: alcohol dehydrogenase catalytic domain-containing protein [Candidatus Atabeyarchaeum deiterrae]
MIAVVISSGGLDVKEVDQPEVRKRDVLIKVMAAGICGTDLAIASRKLKTPLPLIPGHEFTGEVVQTGEDVNGLKTGNRVTSEINLTCGRCFFCNSGVKTHCLNRKAIGIDVNGALADYIAVPVENIHMLPESITYEEGVFIEPLAAAIQTIKMTPISTGSSVAIIGDGRLGQLIAQAIKANVADSRMLMLGKHDSKLGLGVELGGADIAINITHEDPVKAVLSETDGLGANIVVEATGNPNALSLALSIVRHRGTVALKSTHGEQSRIDASQVAVREITLQGSRCGPFEEAIKLLNEKKVKVKPLISAKFPLRKAKEAFKFAKKPEALKVILLPRLE